MQTRRVTQAEWDRRAGPARDSIFAELDPFGLPFADTVVARALLFPISRELEPGQIAALRETARALGDETIFLEVYERFASDPTATGSSPPRETTRTTRSTSWASRARCSPLRGAGG